MYRSSEVDQGNTRDFKGNNHSFFSKFKSHMWYLMNQSLISPQHTLPFKRRKSIPKIAKQIAIEHGHYLLGIFPSNLK